jgi:hypothetical protein
MTIQHIRLLRKSGGKSGTFERTEEAAETPSAPPGSPGA